jgi:hypothetical protein
MNMNDSLTGSSKRAAQLALLIDLEAQWENLRTSQAHAAHQPCTLEELKAKQKAYETFRLKQVAFNKTYSPAFVSEMPRTTPPRLGLWCRKMRDLYLQADQDSGPLPCPVHLLEKAYRYADAAATRTGRARFERRPPPVTAQDAARELDALAHWFEALLGVESAAPVC